MPKLIKPVANMSKQEKAAAKQVMEDHKAKLEAQQKVIDARQQQIEAEKRAAQERAKKEQIAREVAYTMSTTGSYKTNSIVYWLSRTDIKYSDEDFLEYMKSNYKDVFKSDNPYASEDKIVLPEA